MRKPNVRTFYSRYRHDRYEVAAASSPANAGSYLGLGWNRIDMKTARRLANQGIVPLEVDGSTVDADGWREALL